MATAEFPNLLAYRVQHVHSTIFQDLKGLNALAVVILQYINVSIKSLYTLKFNQLDVFLKKQKYLVTGILNKFNLKYRGN